MNPVDLPPELSIPELSNQLRDEISAEANRCVACGLCLPHCPTYKLLQSEPDSPRGRIALMGGVMNGRIPMNQRFALHMDRCLTCRACEAACPNEVRYGELIDKTKTVLRSSEMERPETAPGKRTHWLRKLLMHEFVAKPERIEAMRPLFRFYQASGLQKWARRFRLLGNSRMALLEAQLPLIDKPQSLVGTGGREGAWREIYLPDPSVVKQRGEVGLFLGCVARLADASTINATIRILNSLGYAVHVPGGQTCCGALHQHSGELEEARKLANQNLGAFGALDLQAIITTASGCGAHLADQLPPSTGQAGQERLVVDISAFLAQAEGWDDVRLKSLPCKIAVHDPCSLRNVLRGSAHPYTLLARIPEAEVVPLKGNNQCCGAAGTYFLDQPQLAQALVNEKVDALKDSGAHYLATSNVGCAMHIAGAARKAGVEIEVIHPVTLLARQMV